MKNGEKIWYCSRLSDDNAETDIYDEPKMETLHMSNIFNPISITVQPRNGFTDKLESGETTSQDQRIILRPYEYWKSKFHIGDLFYLDGEEPKQDDEYPGESANYYVESVNNQNNAIELLVKRILNK